MSHDRNSAHQFVDSQLEPIEKNWVLRFLYETMPGRLFLKVMVSPGVTKMMGYFYETKFSKIFIPGFIRKNQIDMEEFEEKQYSSFNDFFIRKKKQILFSAKKEDFISPCDGYLTKYFITKDLVFTIKKIPYSLSDFLGDEQLSKEFMGGDLVVFRLMPKHYHRYHYFDHAVVLNHKVIPGVFHTVRPIALRKVPVFMENTREVSVLQTEHFGKVVQVEVGALGVGKIVNHEHSKGKKGEEKGYFMFGGSTVVLIFQKNQANYHVYKNYFEEEVEVKCGETL